MTNDFKIHNLKSKSRNSTFYFLLSIFWLSVFYFLVSVLSVNAQRLGASLYIAPLQDSPRAGSNFTVTLKMDSLATPINAVKARLKYDKDRLEIINVSKIGSLLNIWLEDPYFSNLEGELRFQGGIPNPGFIGGGGTVLHLILRAKTAGVVSISWESGEVLANDGKGTNILTNLQNLDFVIEEAFELGRKSMLDPLVIINILLIAILLSIGAFFAVRLILRLHDKFYRHKHHEK